MRLSRLPALLGLFMFLSSHLPAAAQNGEGAQCESAPTIVATADFLLEENADTPRFWRDRFGSDAAYLKIHYADIGYDEARALLRSLSKRERPPERIDELRLAHASAADRVNDVAEIRRLHPDRVAILLGPSGLRATAEQNGPDWLFDEVLRRRGTNYGYFGTALAELPNALAGIDEAQIKVLAGRFERAEAWYHALHLLALNADLSDAIALIDRHADHLYRRDLVAQITYSAVVRPDFEPSIQPVEIRAALASSIWLWALRHVYLVGARMPEATILEKVLSRTLDMRVGLWVAQGLLADFQARRLDPDAAPDDAIVAMIEGLDRIFGMEERAKLLAYFPFVQRAHGASTLTAQAFADMSIARAVLAAYLVGDGGEPPARPAALSAQFDWENMLEIATDLRASRLVSDEDQAVAAMLLTSARKPVEALQAIRLASDWKLARSLAHELMLRLDRSCSHRYGHPLPFLPALYRFE